MLSSIQSHRAFTLVELLVVTAILAILGVGAIVGFGSLGEDVAVKQAGQLIEEIINQFKSEILVETYEKTTLYFYPRYLIAVSEPKGSTPILKWNATEDALCPSGEHRLKAYEAGNLLTKNEEETTLEIQAMSPDEDKCVHFEHSAQREWQLQLRNDQAYSPVIRFIHFNPNPEKQGEIGLKTENVRLELTGPYASRKLYQSDILSNQPIALLLKSSHSSTQVMIEP